MFCFVGSIYCFIQTIDVTILTTINDKMCQKFNFNLKKTLIICLEWIYFSADEKNWTANSTINVLSNKTPTMYLYLAPACFGPCGTSSPYTKQHAHWYTGHIKSLTNVKIFNTFNINTISLHTNKCLYIGHFKTKVFCDWRSLKMAQMGRNM
jgi:hypothetical protein